MNQSSAEALSLKAGTRLGKHTILSRLAVGGMAELYLARIEGPGRFEKLCVVKRIRPALADEREFVDMFLREARLAAKLDHPNIAQVLDIANASGEDFIVMEYVHGENVRALLREAGHHGGLSLEAALNIVWGAARGLHHAHEAMASDGRPLRIVHRDVSPANILVSFAGDVKIVDFGIAKALSETLRTRTHALVGKIGYMSPEQCRGAPADARSDLFALGVVLYECTIGRRPFKAESQFAVMNQIVDGRYDRPHEIIADYPPALEAVVERALQVEPADRHPSAQALMLEIEGVAQALGLRLSPNVLADTMRELFGTRPVPSSAVPDPTTEPSPRLEPASADARVDVAALEQLAAPTAAKTRGVGSYLRTAALLLVVAGLAWWIGARGRGDATSDASASAPAGADASDDPVAPARAEPPRVAEVPSPAPAPAAPPPEPSVAAEQPPDATEPRRAAKPERAAKRRPAASKPKREETPRLFPRAYYDRDP